MPEENLIVGFIITLVICFISGLLVTVPFISYLSVLILPFMAGFFGGLFTVKKVHGIAVGGCGAFIGTMIGSNVMISYLSENPTVIGIAVLIISFIAMLAGIFGGSVGAGMNMEKESTRKAFLRGYQAGPTYSQVQAHDAAHIRHMNCPTCNIPLEWLQDKQQFYCESCHKNY